jgi:hypothetical protein
MTDALFMSENKEVPKIKLSLVVATISVEVIPGQ